MLLTSSRALTTDSHHGRSMFRDPPRIHKTEVFGSTRLTSRVPRPEISGPACSTRRPSTAWNRAFHVGPVHSYPKTLNDSVYEALLVSKNF